jgi:hypothetical protein
MAKRLAVCIGCHPAAAMGFGMRMRLEAAMAKVKTVLDLGETAQFHFGDAAGGLGPAEDFLDALSDSEAFGIAGMARCAAPEVLRNNAQFADPAIDGDVRVQVLHEALHIKQLVGGERDAAARIVAADKCQCGIAFCRAVNGGDKLC